MGINKEGRERIVGIRGFLNALLAVKTSMNKLERLLRRILNRKRSSPTLDDLTDIAAIVEEVLKLIRALTSALAALREVFRF